MLLVTFAVKHYSLYHLDINNVFLYGDLDEDIYMDIPPGYHGQGEYSSCGMVCKLNKFLYGLKQASRQWFIKFSTTLLGFGLKKSNADHSYFYKHDNGIYLGIIIYVDDILIARNQSSLVQQLKDHLGKHFHFKDFGPPKYFLGLKINKTDTRIFICQRKYILDLLQDTSLTGCKPCSTPMDSTTHLHACEEGLLTDPKVYRRLIERLLYLGFTRPDIWFVVYKLIQFMSKPCHHHLTIAY